MDETDATLPVPRIPAATQPNETIGDQNCDSVADVKRAAWEECYRTEMRQLVRYLMKCFGDSDMRDAVDAAQSAFAELFAKWDGVRNPRAWLRKVGFRQMLRQHPRVEYALDALPQEPAAPSASVPLELRQEARTVLDLLRQLPVAQRQVLALICDQFSYREIAEITNTSEAAVRQNAVRARARMKELLGDRRTMLGD